ncbi:uncharacterized protein LOC143027614 [Oratosquilla oratoria]|uniref:uncharacterized protein LOC143027614 n=1 Tax=Oratosquilla oratoria TaxID=337810 RepID=UPI003F775D5F
MATRKSNKKLEDMVETLLKARKEDKISNEQARKEDRQFLRSTVVELKDLITRQQQEISDLRSTVGTLQARVDDLEQYTRKEDIIISGLKVVKSYSDIVKGDSDFSEDNSGRNIVENQVIETE